MECVLRWSGHYTQDSGHGPYLRNGGNNIQYSREDSNPQDRCAVAVVKDEKSVTGHSVSFQHENHMTSSDFYII